MTTDPVKDYSIKLEYIVEATGTKADMQALVEKIDEAAFGAMGIHCGGECCPLDRGPHYVSGAYGFSTFNEGPYEWDEEES